MNKADHLQAVTAKARAIMARNNIEALVVTTPDNFCHVTGFASFFMYTFRHTGAALAVIFRDEKLPSLIVMNEFEAAGLQFDLANYELKTFPVWVDVDEPFNPQRVVKERPIGPPVEAVFTLLKSTLADAGVLDKNIAIELNAMSNGGKQTLDKVIPNLRLVDSTAIFNELRMVKSPWEIAFLRKSAQITEYGISEAFKAIGAGCSAWDLTAAYKAAVMQHPETNLSRFHLISVGDDFAPKLLPSREPVKPGDLIKFDCGVDVAGYGADLARTVVFGQPTAMAERIYQTILLGHEHMLSLIGPGVKLSHVFNDTMSKIKANGLPHYNRGHLGHGDGLFLGLEEAPFVSAAATETFEPGMVFSVETPYYGIGVGAIMLEDMLLITDDGYELFSQLPRTLQRFE
ncbi:M24 family metallopeptidase [Klebsiella sp. Ap-873]|uniref:Peptidase n=1 Tax=Cedecea neteri TaxID=158822 RepID=A0AAN0VVI5_9ENTR|nr:M24 family metallopeptidase [Cedecea neteri]AIR63442.1 peptidase [Cedecea neteri]NIG76001.1 M24 family metallopeptidase [Klebsiella sp. Ap-873]